MEAINTLKSGRKRWALRKKIESKQGITLAQFGESDSKMPFILRLTAPVRPMAG
jgi:hypothetical protein